VLDIVDRLEVIANPLHSSNQLDLDGRCFVKMRRWRVGWWYWVGDELANSPDFLNDLVDFFTNRA
jgi:hypothetical protein